MDICVCNLICIKFDVCDVSYVIKFINLVRVL